MQRLLVILVVTLAAPAVSGVRTAAAQAELGGCQTWQQQSLRMETVGEHHYRLLGSVDRPVVIDCDDVQFFAESVELFRDTNRVVATGNVLFVSSGNRIAAERMEFDTRTRTGTFYTASGTANLGDRADRSLFGTQEPDAFFWGEELQKLGPRKYRITRGGFTTCVQPTPRWEITSGSVTMNLDDYALLTNSVFRVKGVPVMYLPVFYYPIQEDDRATGFLIPTYGMSNVRGQTISNAFFWAIGRSHDATVLHDWFSKTGQGTGVEYRYVLSGASQGNSRFYLLNEREATYALPGGAQTTSPAQRSYRFDGSLVQQLPGRLRARANANYFSSIQTEQRYHQNIYQATNRTRVFGANVSGEWRQIALSSTFDRNDTFFGQDTIVTHGALPRVNLSRPEQPLGGLPLYASVSGEYVNLLRSSTQNDVRISDQGLSRFDVTPVLRVPFTRWPFLTINSSVAWRGTYWTESLDASGVQVPDGIGRRYFDLRSRLTGPVFNRIFDTPGRAYAQRWKHVIEPSFDVQRTTAIDVFDRIVQLEPADPVVGSVTRFGYALANRLYAKREAVREIASLTISQSYYTDARAAQYDRQYQSSFSGPRQTNFSPVALVARVNPTERLQGDFRTEWDPRVKALLTLAANGSFATAERLQVWAGWSQRRLIPELPGFDNPAQADHYLNASATVRGPRNRVGGTYSFNYDLRRETFAQQRYLAYYNAQCCGVGVEYQTFNFHGGFGGLAIPQDRRFNLSFSLAGIGTFSNLFGAFGAQQERR